MIRESVSQYIARGWAPVRIPPLRKGPVDQDWPTISYPPEVFAPEDNVGIKLGDPSGGLVDVDLDRPEAVELAPRFLPGPTATFGRPGKLRSHWIYVSHGLLTWRPKTVGVELRSTGLQTVFPPSVHESGEPISWTDETLPLVIDPIHLRAAFARLSLGVTLARLLPDLQRARGVHDFVLALAGTLRNEGWAESAVLDLLGRSIGLEERHRDGAVRSTFAAEGAYTGWTTLQEIVGPPAAKRIKTLASDESLGLNPPSIVAVEGGQPTNDSGNASRILERVGDDYRYCRGWGWLRWDGVRWCEDQGPWEIAEIVARELQAEGHTLGGPAGKAIAEWGRQSGNAGRIRGALDVASNRSAVRVAVSDLDPDPWLLCVSNGVIDLRTGLLREHRRGDLITKMAPVEYDPEAECPRFAKFLLECMGDDPARALYLLRLLGYGLTGSVDEHVLSIWWGAKGRNGKGVLERITLAIMGDYACRLSSEILMMSRGEQHTTGLTDLRGRRLVFAPEWPDGRRLNEALVRQLTGADRIRARRMRENNVEFDPTHKLIVVGNYRPIVREQSEAFWARVHLLPWTVSFRHREDPNLERTLMQEAPGILRYLVAGCRAWLLAGRRLRPPEAVQAAGDDYRQAMDVVGAFLVDHIDDDPSAFVPRAEVYARYKMWAIQTGEHVLSARVFYRILESERGWSRASRRGVRGFLGHALRKSLTG